MESVPTILRLNFVTGLINKQLRVELARKYPKEAIQLLVAFFQDQHIVATPSIPKGEDQCERHAGHSYNDEEYRSLHELTLALDIQLIIAQVNLVELFDNINLK